MLQRRGTRKKRNFFFSSLYINLGAQYMTTIIAAVLLAGLVFTGFLLFHNSDKDDILIRGKKYMAEGKNAWAVQTFEDLLLKHPNSYQGHVSLGKAHLALGHQKEAEASFLTAASLQTRGSGNYAAEIAQSKLLLAQKKPAGAEKKLLESLRQSEESKDKKGKKNIKQALFELYENWGNTLHENSAKRHDVIEKFDKALQYVTDYETEDRLKDKLLDFTMTEANTLLKKKNDKHAIALLKSSLRYRYDPDTLVQIAEMYEKTKNINEAIIWYRKAYDSSPDVIGLKLSNMLTQKGHNLTKANKKAEAKKFFTEAAMIQQTTTVSPSVVYPIEISQFQINPIINRSTGMLTPIIKIRYENQGHRSLSFLATRVMFRSGGRTLSKVVRTVATIDTPLAQTGEKHSSKTISLQPEKAFNVRRLPRKTVTVEVAISYTQDEKPNWETKLEQNIVLRGSLPTARAKSTSSSLGHKNISITKVKPKTTGIPTPQSKPNLPPVPGSAG